MSNFSRPAQGLPFKAILPGEGEWPTEGEMLRSPVRKDEDSLMSASSPACTYATGAEIWGGCGHDAQTGGVHKLLGVFYKTCYYLQYRHKFPSNNSLDL